MSRIANCFFARNPSPSALPLTGETSVCLFEMTYSLIAWIMYSVSGRGISVFGVTSNLMSVNSTYHKIYAKGFLSTVYERYHAWIQLRSSLSIVLSMSVNKSSFAIHRRLQMSFSRMLFCGYAEDPISCSIVIGELIFLNKIISITTSNLLYVLPVILQAMSDTPRSIGFSCEIEHKREIDKKILDTMADIFL